jgi:hypothetical protein
MYGVESNNTVARGHEIQGESTIRLKDAKFQVVLEKKKLEIIQFFLMRTS